MSAKLIITQDELSKVKNNILNKDQLAFLLQKTPDRFIKKRDGRGSQKWDYVSGSYIIKVLNMVFGWDWDFEVKSDRIEFGEVIALGMLTVRVGDRKLVKSQYGNKQIVMKRENNQPLSIGNDFKAAATDALKKCAFLLGIASDVYSPDDFVDTQVLSNDESLEMLKDLYEQGKNMLSDSESKRIYQIIQNKEIDSYTKSIRLISNKIKEHAKNS